VIGYLGKAKTFKNRKEINMVDSIWSKDGTAYQKGEYIYTWEEAVKRGFVSKEEGDLHDKNEDEEQD